VIAAPSQSETRNLTTTMPVRILLIRRCGRTPLAIPRYAPRNFRSLDTWRFSDWRIKAYGIAAEAPNHPAVLNGQMVEEARAFVAANLDRMNSTPHYSVGFAILHHGSAAKSLLTQWWTNECVCLQYVGQSEFAGPPKFKPAKEDLMACAYELIAIDFERRAWVSTVMAGKPMEAYLEARLPDGLY
jgi:hypothetical protein